MRVAAFLLAGMAAGSAAAQDWVVQSDYFAERNAVAQSRTIRSMALSADGASVYTGLIQSPNVGSNAIRKVSSDVLAIPGTAHVIFGNGMPGGTGPFGPVGGQPVYAGGSTGTFEGWIGTANSPRGLATDDRGYVYAALSSGISSANAVVIYDEDLTTKVGEFAVTGPTGVAIHRVGSTYFAYVASGNQLRRWDVTNPSSPAATPDPTWTPPIASGAENLTVDKNGVVFLAGGDQVRRISADGTTVTHTVDIDLAVDVAVFQDRLYVICRDTPGAPIIVLNKSDLTSAADDIVVPALGATRGDLAQFTAIDISSDGRIYVSEENYTGAISGSNAGAVTEYTSPATAFNPMPGMITGRIYFDRVLVSPPLPVLEPVEVTIDVCPLTNLLPINLNSNGDLPVAVFSRPDFDAREIDDSLVRFGDFTLFLLGDGDLVSPVDRLETDVNCDGLQDVILFFSIPEIVAVNAMDRFTTEAYLDGETEAGLPFFGTDDVCVIPKIQLPPPLPPLPPVVQSVVKPVVNILKGLFRGLW